MRRILGAAIGAIGGLLLTLAGGAATAGAAAGRPGSSGGNGTAVHVRRLEVVGAARPGAHVWAVSADNWSVYSSLYSRQLRAWLSHEPVGTTVWIDTNPAAAVHVGQARADAAEIRDFRAFCTGRGLHFSFAPVAG